MRCVWAQSDICIIFIFHFMESFIQVDFECDAKALVVIKYRNRLTYTNTNIIVIMMSPICTVLVTKPNNNHCTAQTHKSLLIIHISRHMNNIDYLRGPYIECSHIKHI